MYSVVLKPENDTVCDFYHLLSEVYCDSILLIVLRLDIEKMFIWSCVTVKMIHFHNLFFIQVVSVITPTFTTYAVNCTSGLFAWKSNQLYICLSTAN